MRTSLQPRKGHGSSVRSVSLIFVIFLALVLILLNSSALNTVVKEAKSADTRPHHVPHKQDERRQHKHKEQQKQRDSNPDTTSVLQTPSSTTTAAPKPTTIKTKGLSHLLLPPRSDGKLFWQAKNLYLPISDDAKQSFLVNNQKQRDRLNSNPELKRMRESFDISKCSEETPECEFWTEIGADIINKKCCVEHMKMKKALFHTLDVLDAAGVDCFLDSGTLLSSMRDNVTLVPWETDIDLGVVGVIPDMVEGPFKRRTSKSHLFQRCAVKVSKNVSRNGMCRDAHYVYYVKDEAQSHIDTSRVEIWPFWPENGMLLHPTRKKLHVPKSMVLPLKLTDCFMWGRRCKCPHDPD
eukprot:PhM_4_TR13637/c0_g1_i2/m.13196/K19873/FKRP; fukutin-related protein